MKNLLLLGILGLSSTMANAAMVEVDTIHLSFTKKIEKNIEYTMDGQKINAVASVNITGFSENLVTPSYRNPVDLNETYDSAKAEFCSMKVQSWKDILIADPGLNVTVKDRGNVKYPETPGFVTFTYTHAEGKHFKGDFEINCND